MVAGNKRRKVEDSKPLTYEDIALTLLDIREPRNQCLIALLYLSGRRIGEVLHLQRKHFRVDANRISFETFNEKVYRSKRGGNYTIRRKNKFYERIRPHWRTDTLSGKALTIFVTNTLDSLDIEAYLFKPFRGKQKHIGYGMAYKIVRYYLPDAWPHLLRHERFTEASKIYKDNPVAMHRFTFHKRFESTLQYIRRLEEEKI